MTRKEEGRGSPFVEALAMPFPSSAFAATSWGETRNGRVFCYESGAVMIPTLSRLPGESGPGLIRNFGGLR